MNILNVNTGNEKFDEAYKKIQVHVSSFDDFIAFKSYFNDIVKTDDMEKLNDWLLKVLFWEFKHGRPEASKKHDFDVLMEVVPEDKANQFRVWLKANLEKYNGGVN